MVGLLNTTLLHYYYFTALLLLYLHYYYCTALLLLVQALAETVSDQVVIMFGGFETRPYADFNGRPFTFFEVDRKRGGGGERERKRVRERERECERLTE